MAGLLRRHSHGTRSTGKHRSLRSLVENNTWLQDAKKLGSLAMDTRFAIQECPSLEIINKQKPGMQRERERVPCKEPLGNSTQERMVSPSTDLVFLKCQ